VEETKTSKSKTTSDFLKGDYFPLSKRGISEETCRKFGYRIADFKGQKVQVADYRTPNGELVAQKVRFKDKNFTCLGSIKEAGLFGQHLWRDSGKMVVVTEGEIDAMTVSQLQGNKWPVVSIPNGAGKGKGAKRVAKQIADNIEWLCKFEKVILFFDNDEPGQDSAEAVAAILPPGKAHIVKMPEYKDANEAHQAGDSKLVIDAIWSARTYRPDGLVTISDLHDDLMKPVEWGLSWPFEKLTNLTYGIRRGEIYAFGAGTGVGKTDVMIQTASHLLVEHEVPVGLFYLEQSPKETIQRLCGKIKGKLFHLPDGGWTHEEWEASVKEIEEMELVYLYNHFGQTDWDVIKSRIRYLASARDVKDIFLDHLTALATGGDQDEKVELERIMSEMASLAQELDITIYFVSHLATPDGKPHEEGGRVMIRHFKGSRAIGFWSHFMFGLERNQQADDEDERRTTTFRVLKDRKSGRATGEIIELRYDQETGLLHEEEIFKDEFEPLDNDPLEDF
jgi:twinkle protein